MFAENHSGVEILPAKYVFLDVVKFTVNRSVEAQSDIVATLNSIVRDSLAHFDLTVEDERVICIPTGDGLCIAILGANTPYDAHVQLACEILERISAHSAAADPSRRFDVRIGISENTDNVVTDINGRRNVAGAGINVAARVMDVADAAQIVVSQHVYETVAVRERYMNAFRPLSVSVKHGYRLNVYQLITERPGLSTVIPAAAGRGAVRFFGTKEEAYDDLCETVKDNSVPIESFDLLEFSGFTTHRLLSSVARNHPHARIRLLLLAPARAVEFDADGVVHHDGRITGTLEHLRVLRNETGARFAVRYYSVPPSMSLAQIDDRIVCLSWYLSYHDGPDPRVLRLRGHTCAAITATATYAETLLPFARTHFQRLWLAEQTTGDETFPDFPSA
ncbi:MAG TPA: adenylate/guanylate cyclase domain-containing protein [Thermoanaerobaculia bacterium]|nr:adenylate/guanylate cyclase domain-containing protein [Thermoanaerobaculia bacterium]